jgi:hypothetical protein
VGDVLCHGPALRGGLLVEDMRDVLHETINGVHIQFGSVHACSALKLNDGSKQARQNDKK